MKKKRLNFDLKEKWQKVNFAVVIIAVFLCFSLSVSYAVLSQTLDISGSVIISAGENINITTIEDTSSSSCGLNIIEPQYTDDSFLINVDLPDLSCEVQYKITMINNGKSAITITDIFEEIYNNELIIYQIVELEIGDVIVPSEEKTFVVSLKYRDDLLTIPQQTTIGLSITLSWENYIPSEESNTCVVEVPANNAINLPMTGGSEFSRAYGVIEIVFIDKSNKPICNPLTPILGGLIPVKWDTVDPDTVSTWSNPETVTTADDDTWYSYVAQTGSTGASNPRGTSRWANARTSDGNKYFVWIPRYAYKITYFDNEVHKNAYRNDNTSTTGIIGYSTVYGMVNASDNKIVTGTERTIDNKISGAYSDYIPHPAFEIGNSKDGFWFSKFEVAGSLSNVIIKPNSAILSGIDIKDMANIYTVINEFSGTNNLAHDSHISKNTEWGAVTYLTDSKYGRNGTEVFINPSNATTGGSGYIPDYTSAHSTMRNVTDVTNTTGIWPWNNYYRGVLASTTANMYGIYDMSGANAELVMGVIGDSNGLPRSGYTSAKSSGFKGSYYNGTQNTTGLDFPNIKYYDLYVESTKTNTASDKTANYAVNKHKYGDAMYETSTAGTGNTGWNSDATEFPYVGGPWVVRGARTTAGASGGIFMFNSPEYLSNYKSFRVTLTP